MYHDHEPYGGGAAHPDRRAEGAGLWGRHYYVKIYDLLGSGSSGRMCFRLHCRDMGVPGAYLVLLWYDVQGGPRLLCIQLEAGGNFLYRIPALLHRHHMAVLPGGVEAGGGCIDAPQGAQGGKAGFAGVHSFCMEAAQLPAQGVHTEYFPV